MSEEAVTVKELDEKIDELFELRKDYTAKKKISNDADLLFKSKQTEIAELLENLGKSKYSTNSGTVGRSVESYFGQPQDPASKKLFTEYLKMKGDYEDLVSVNSQKLNSYAKQEVLASKELDFQIPGLSKTNRIKISMIKAR